MVRVDGSTGELRVLVGDAEWQSRPLAPRPEDDGSGCGRELFAFMRQAMSPAEQGACSFTAELTALR
ncbi:phosphogluconate dehydratase [compost metagenome]